MLYKGRLEDHLRQTVHYIHPQETHLAPMRVANGLAGARHTVTALTWECCNTDNSEAKLK
jgi:hypothetical protein